MQLSSSTSLTLKLIGVLLLSVTLVACGSSDSDSSRRGNIIDGATPSPSPGTDTDDDTQPGDDEDEGDSGGEIDGGPSQLGSGIDADFDPGTIEVGIGTATLSPGGRTALSVTLVNHQNVVVVSPVEVAFSSRCLSAGSAYLTGTTGENSNVAVTAHGQATVTYHANGCVGEDRITARATYEGVLAGSAWGSVTVGSDTVQNLVFVGAEPEIIQIRQAGGLETSRVSFQVLGATGSPMRDVPVNFSLNHTLGNLSLVHASDTSDEIGMVSTIVQAGNVPTAVWVTASTGDAATQSNRLAVTTGIPDQNSASLSAENHYPVAWNHDGIETGVTMRLADAFNNPPPDGTTVYFTTSGGAIDPTCQTENGACSVMWRSQNPRPGSDQPQLFSFGPIVDDYGRPGYGLNCPLNMKECRAGRVVVLATALGNESFIDETGSGLYEGPDVDIFVTTGNCDPSVPVSGASVIDTDNRDTLACDDLGEAYLDKNFNRVRDSGEEFVDLNGDGQYSGPNGIYNGVLCSDGALAADLCTRDPITIREHQTIVMSCEYPYAPGNRLPGQRDITLGLDQETSITMLLADCNGNGMPQGTTVSVNENQAENVTTSHVPENALMGSGEPSVIRLTVKADDTDPASGTLWIDVAAPTESGEVTTSFGIDIN